MGCLKDIYACIYHKGLLRVFFYPSTDNPVGGNCKLFKGELKFENYLDILEDKDKFTLCRFRTTNHRLSIEVGRWKQIIRENRFCHLCSRRELGDEYHYVFECTEFVNERKLYFDFVYINRHSIIKYNNLMSSKSIYTLS